MYRVFTTYHESKMQEICIILYIALLFIVSNRKKTTSDIDFFTAGKNSSWPAVAFGMVGATISGISLISVPGMVVNSSFFYMQMVLGFILGYMAVAYVLLPIYYKLGSISIYSYLETRFGVKSRQTVSALFLINKMLSSAVKLYVVMLVLHLFIFEKYGISFEMATLIVVAVIFAYTFRNGVKSVVMTDCIQTACLIIVTVILLVEAFSAVNGDFIDVFNYVSSEGLSKTFDFESVSNKTHFIKQFISGAFIVVVMTGLDQDVMQKNLTCRNLKEAQKNMVMTGILFTPVNFMLLVLGATLIYLAHIQGLTLPEKTDEIVPLFCNQFGDVAICGLTLGMVAASFSSADSALVGMTTCLLTDVMHKDLSKVSRSQRYAIHGVLALMLVLVILLFNANAQTSAINIIYTIVSYVMAPILGMFMFGIFTKREITDKATPFICMATPFVMYYIDTSSAEYGYKFGYELLLLGAFVTILGLCLTTIGKSSK
ncbi:MAG: sodium:solute symporter [Paludibacteraceae bacterium]|nr:sodium:solute symporter [Paludibacteraceae bacterium]